MTWKEAKREMMFAKRNVLEGSYIDQAYDKAIEALSQSERKKGRWIDKGMEGSWNYCSVCGERAIDLYDYCPNCGADMRGESE